MKRKCISLLALLVIMFTTMFSVRANTSDNLTPPMLPQLLELQVRYVDPTIGDPQIPKSPVQAPEVYIDDHTLTFDSSCHNCTLRLVDAENEVVYTTVISSSTLVLPATLEGTYELQIIRDNWCFYGDIAL